MLLGFQDFIFFDTIKLLVDLSRINDIKVQVY